MKVSVKNKTIIVLKLNEREADWLMHYLEDYPGNSSEEPPGSTELRLALYDMLRDSWGSQS